MHRKKRQRQAATASGLSRRQFFGSVGGTAVIAAAGCGSTTQAVKDQAPLLAPEELSKISLTINGRRHQLLVEPRWSLLFVLREQLGLNATKLGCGRGECGACTVLIDDQPRYACLTLAVEAQDQQITTLEGLMQGEQLGPVQRAFVEQDAFQCGYCTPGQIMAVEGLLRQTTQPTQEQIRLAVSGNLCRCGAYVHIFAAAQQAAALKRQGG